MSTKVTVGHDIAALFLLLSNEATVVVCVRASDRTVNLSNGIAR